MKFGLVSVDFGLNPKGLKCSWFSPVSLNLGKVVGPLQPNAGALNGQKNSVVAAVFLL